MQNKRWRHGFARVLQWCFSWNAYPCNPFWTRWMVSLRSRPSSAKKDFHVWTHAIGTFLLHESIVQFAGWLTGRQAASLNSWSINIHEFGVSHEGPHYWCLRFVLYNSPFANIPFNPVILFSWEFKVFWKLAVAQTKQIGVLASEAIHLCRQTLIGPLGQA